MSDHGRGKGRTVRTAASRLATLISGDFQGLSGRPVEVQVNVADRRQAAFAIVGLPGRSTRESRERIRAAIENSGYEFPREEILVNLAPAACPKQDAGFDLPVALGILLASRQVPGPVPDGARAGILERTGFLGELGLQGEVRPVAGSVLIADRLRARGIREWMVAPGNAAEIALHDALAVHPVRDLREAVAVLGEGRAPVRSLPGRDVRPADVSSPRAPDFADVRGQETTKRGCLIAAAGGHNLVLTGPPGVGKTMLARRLPAVLPPLDTEEAMEVLRVRSALGLPCDPGLPRERPFRSPHHTVSYAGMVGGSAALVPGEVTRAHRGVLFLDEFPEFPRRVLEALREPLEAGRITVGRSTGAVTFPASVLLVAAMNPCPCGHLGHPRRPCRCSPRQIEAYQGRISGPLADRLDIWLQLAPPDPELLLGASGSPGLDTRTLAELASRARARQRARWGAGGTNARAGLRDLVDRGRADPGALTTLRRSAERLCLSARGFTRALRVARTIADLEGKEPVDEACVLEALQIRRPGRPS